MSKHTLEHIQRMFNEMGLGSEKDRAKFLKWSEHPKMKTAPDTIVVTTSGTSTEANEEVCNAKLA